MNDQNNAAPDTAVAPSTPAPTRDLRVRSNVKAGAFPGVRGWPAHG